MPKMIIFRWYCLFVKYHTSASVSTYTYTFSYSISISTSKSIPKPQFLCHQIHLSLFLYLPYLHLSLHEAPLYPLLAFSLRSTFRTASQATIRTTFISYRSFISRTDGFPAHWKHRSHPKVLTLLSTLPKAATNYPFFYLLLPISSYFFKISTKC